AADADGGRDLAAGESGDEAAPQKFKSFVCPGLRKHVSVPGWILWGSFRPRTVAAACSSPYALPLSRIESSPSLIARRMPSSISVLATPGTLVPWVPCLTSFSR